MGSTGTLAMLLLFPASARSYFTAKAQSTQRKDDVSPQRRKERKGYILV